jgi:hypothetical protein
MRKRKSHVSIESRKKACKGTEIPSKISESIEKVIRSKRSRERITSAGSRFRLKNFLFFFFCSSLVVAARGLGAKERTLRLHRPC